MSGAEAVGSICSCERRQCVAGARPTRGRPGAPRAAAGALPGAEGPGAAYGGLRRRSGARLLPRRGFRRSSAAPPAGNEPAVTACALLPERPSAGPRCPRGPRAGGPECRSSRCRGGRGGGGATPPGRPGPRGRPGAVARPRRPRAQGLAYHPGLDQARLREQRGVEEHDRSPMAARSPVRPVAAASAAEVAPQPGGRSATPAPSRTYAGSRRGRPAAPAAPRAVRGRRVRPGCPGTGRAAAGSGPRRPVPERAVSGVASQGGASPEVTGAQPGTGPAGRRAPRRTDTSASASPVSHRAAGPGRPQVSAASEAPTASTGSSKRRRSSRSAARRPPPGTGCGPAAGRRCRRARGRQGLRGGLPALASAATGRSRCRRCGPSAGRPAARGGRPGPAGRRIRRGGPRCRRRAGRGGGRRSPGRARVRPSAGLQVGVREGLLAAGRRPRGAAGGWPRCPGRVRVRLRAPAGARSLKVTARSRSPGARAVSEYGAGRAGQPGGEQGESAGRGAAGEVGADAGHRRAPGGAALGGAHAGHRAGVDVVRAVARRGSRVRTASTRASRRPSTALAASVGGVAMAREATGSYPAISRAPVRRIRACPGGMRRTPSWAWSLWSPPRVRRVRRAALPGGRCRGGLR